MNKLNHNSKYSLMCKIDTQNRLRLCVQIKMDRVFLTFDLLACNVIIIHTYEIERG